MALAAELGRPLSRAQLVSALNDHRTISERTIDTHIKNLRAKIEPDPRQPCYILTVYGVGYTFGEYVAFCDDVYPPSQALAGVYAQAVGYPVFEGFYDYAITGEATDWLACAGVPTIAVELTNHTDTDRAQNLAAMQAVIDVYGAGGREDHRLK